tara:strand:+ start:850 stop:1425 length:576 start_codon:yes stop_codon:yes gene_type:complete
MVFLGRVLFRSATPQPMPPYLQGNHFVFLKLRNAEEFLSPKITHPQIVFGRITRLRHNREGEVEVQFTPSGAVWPREEKGSQQWEESSRFFQNRYRASAMMEEIFDDEERRNQITLNARRAFQDFRQEKLAKAVEMFPTREMLTPLAEAYAEGVLQRHGDVSGVMDHFLHTPEASESEAPSRATRKQLFRE